MAAPIVPWSLQLGHDSGGPVAAWVFSLAAAGAFATLPPTADDRRNIAGRRSDDADRFLARRSVLRHLVARRSGVPAASVAIDYQPAGAPVIVSPADGLFCSVAARGNLAAVALADRPVGIDLEPLVPAPIPWAVLAAEERRGLDGLEPVAQTAAFLRLWTVKEAYLKARRSGLLTDPALVVVMSNPPGIRHGSRSMALAPSAWHRCTVGGQAVIAACVAIEPFVDDAPAIT